jgi:hypothetical protein
LTDFLEFRRKLRQKGKTPFSNRSTKNPVLAGDVERRVKVKAPGGESGTLGIFGELVQKLRRKSV